MYTSYNMYVYPIRIHENGVLTPNSLLGDIDSLFSSFCFDKRLSSEEKTDDGHKKISSIYIRNDLTAFIAITPEGNNLTYNDPHHKNHVCAGYVSLLGLPEPKNLDVELKHLIGKIEQLKHRYENGLENFLKGVETEGMPFQD